MSSIAFYSCNFGNYRNELSTINNINFEDDVDYYFFTDTSGSYITNLPSKWKIIVMDTRETRGTGDNIMNDSRWASKYIKFILPDVLKSYKTIIWADCKLLNNNFHINIKSLQDYSLVNILHSRRKTPQEELNKTIKLNLENKINGKLFLKEIKYIKHQVPLIDTCFIIRKNDTTTNLLFEKVYSLLKTKGLKRDQNVYNHAIHILNYPISNINLKNGLI